MRRPLSILVALSAAALLAGACESPTSVASDLASVTVDLGSVVALDSLRTVDAATVPCCTVDSAGARVSILSGTLTFQRYAHYSDTVFTPAGPMSGACVTEIPNGAVLHLNGLVPVGDTVAYLMIPCRVGGYTLVLTQRVDFPGDSARTLDVTVSSGTYSWTRDALLLMDASGHAVPATMAADTIVILASGHTYKLQAVRFD